MGAEEAIPLMIMMRVLTVCSFVLSLSLGAAEHTFKLPAEADALLDTYCYSCHDDDTQKGDIQLDNLIDLEPQKRLDMLNRMQEQLFFSHMPPKKKKQPKETEREALLAMLSAELSKQNASTLEGKLAKFEFANYVDHAKLFSGEYKDLPAFTDDRRWLISEYIFSDKFDRMLWGQATGYAGNKRVPASAFTR
jgi:cytochrome c553